MSATLCAQQLPVPVVSHARSTANTGLIRGDGAVPFPVATLKMTRSKSGLGSMSRAAINFDMHQGTTDPAQFLFLENWTSEAALKAHFETPHIKNWLKQAEGLLAEPLEVTLWNRVA